MDIENLTIVKAIKGLKSKEFTSRDIVEAYLARMDRLDYLNAFITKTTDLALKQADESDKRLVEGQGRRMEGIPLAIKDLICTEGIRTTVASQMLHNYIAPYNAGVMDKLYNDGCIMLGKTNMDEFAMGSTGTTSVFGDTISFIKSNKDDKGRNPGGSSSGSAAAVAGNLCLGALGSDTGGSVRQPASLCGIVGMKPTYGRVSRYGVVAFGSSFDQLGPMTRNVEDCAILLESMAGHDPRDATSAKREVPSYYQSLNSDIRGKKVGIVKEFGEILRKFGENDIINAYGNALETLKKLGCELVEISLPFSIYTPSIYIAVAYTEAASNFARYDGLRYGHRIEDDNNEYMDSYAKTRQAGFGLNIQKRILMAYTLSSTANYENYFVKAAKLRRMITDDVLDAFNRVDVIFAPASSKTAETIESIKSSSNSTIPNDADDIFVFLANMAGGLPAISIPYCKSNDGLPIGMQVIGRRFDEQQVLDVALAIEKFI